MSKAGKRAKSNTAPPGGAKWELALNSATFEEDHWKPNVSFVIGNRVDDYRHIEALTATVSTGVRRLFTLVTKESLYEEVKELGNPKSKKPKEVPANYEVCEPCKIHLDAGEEIPLPLLAKLIKFRLMAIKSADVKRREVERKAALEKEKAKKDKAAGKDARAKSPPKKGGKKTPEPQAAKDGSKLKKRGEDDSENKFIDDEPDDGAQHYILLVGFLEPHLLQFLAEVGIGINCVLRIASQDYSRFPSLLADSNLPEKDEKALAAEEAIKDERNKLTLKLSIFWKDVLPLLRVNHDACKQHDLQDIARLDYEVKSLLLPANPEDPEQKTQFGTAMYEDIACMIYDLQDARRLYRTYLQNLKLIGVPSVGEKAHDKSAGDGQSTGAPPTPALPIPPTSSASAHLDISHSEVMGPPDMRCYNDLMNTIPQESISVALMMHCMLEQVAATEENRDPPSEQPLPPRVDGLNGHVADHLSGIAFKLALSEEEHKALSEVLDLPQRPPEQPKPPLLMNIHDHISIRTQHLKNSYDLNPLEIEKQMLRLLPIAEQCRTQRPTSAEARARAARLQELIHFCATNGLSPSEIDRAFKQFVFESMDLAATDPNGFLLTREAEGLVHSSIPWDDPYPFFKGMIPKEEKMSMMELIETSSEERSGARSPGPNGSGSQSLDTERSCNSRGERNSRPTSRASSMDSKKGILRSPSGSASPHRGRSRSSSYEQIGTSHRNSVVHFDVPQDHNLAEEEAADALLNGTEITEHEKKSVEDTMMEVVDAQKRVLDQWCFAEHYEPHVLLQVMREAAYTMPFMETYHHKRDQSTMLVFYNPYNNELQNHVDWHTELHSNVGFRNYLEYVAESIADWLKEKEAEYQAHLLSAEVEKMRLDDSSEFKPGDKKGKKSPRKSARSKSPKGGSRSSSVESLSSTNPYVRANSLKAWKEEQDRIKAEEEEAESLKKDKRARSAQKRAAQKKEKEDKEKEEKKPSSRSSSKSKMSLRPDDAPTGDEQPEPIQEEEAFWPFTGYDTSNNMLHVSGITTTLFPSDGGQIRSERTEFVQGTTAVRTAVLKDGHVFTVHVLNPREGGEEPDNPDVEAAKAAIIAKAEQQEKAELEKSEKEEKEIAAEEKEPKKPPPASQFGSITACLADGMLLSLSQWGAAGQIPEGKPYEPAPYVIPVSSPTPQPPAASPNKGKKDKGKAAPTPEPVPAQEDEVPVEVVEEKKVPEQPFQEVFVTCPDGLQVRYFLQSSVGVAPTNTEDRHLVVKQSYPFKMSSSQDCEAARKPYIMNEVSRVITADGSVVKNMVDGSVEVLYADGMVAVHTGPWALVSSRSSSPVRGGSARSVADRSETPTKKEKGRSASKGRQPAPVEKGAEIAVNLPESMDEQEKRGIWTITYPNGERCRTKPDGGSDDLKPVMICVASDPDTKQTMATRDDHVITVSYPDGTTVVEHGDGTRITVYYRDTQVPIGEETTENGEPADIITQTLKFVKIECPAYATVEFNCATSENLTVFGSGSSINVFPDGYYILHHAKGGRVEVDTEGTMVYYPRPNKNMEQLLPERDLQYVLRHNADVICETVDPDGNVFTVKNSGDFSVLPSNGGDELSENSDDQPQNGEKKLIRYGQHAPRFFIVHADGSGTELLRYQDIAEYLTTAERNPATAVLKEPLPEYPGVTGMTILKPYIGGLSERWLKNYDQASIIPNGIRSRDLTNIPPQEFKKPGPKFGSNVGQGLSVGAAIKTQARIAILKCPTALELRQFVQYRPVCEELRERLQQGLRGYAEYVMERMHLDKMMEVEDPRSEDEKMLATDLLTAAISQRPEPVEPDFIKDIYEKTIAPPPPSPPPTPQPKRTQADWERDQRELQEENEGRFMLRGKKVPRYFESEMGKAFLLTQAKDMDELLKELSEDPRHDGTEAMRTEASQLTYTRDAEPSPASRQLHSQPGGVSQMSDRSATESDSPATMGAMTRSKLPPETPLSFAGGAMSEVNGQTPSGIRPGNPTPAHAGGQGSPANLRPKNPTPAKASKVVTDRPEEAIASSDSSGDGKVNPTPKMAGGYAETPSEFEIFLRGHPMIIEQPMEEERVEFPETEADLVITPSLKVNVVGELRSNPVPLPSSILGGRPNAKMNTKYIEVEDPVRRHVRNCVVQGTTVMGSQMLQRMQGLSVFPEEVNFGVLREGCTYAYLLQLKNTGMDSCRFKVRQPPPATGLRILYKPGAVAAGMKAELRLELYAIAVGVEGESGVGTISHDLEIITETDLLRVPVQATVMTAYEYDIRNQNSPTVGKAPGTVLISNKPPSSTGIIRPRKQLLAVMTAYEYDIRNQNSPTVGKAPGTVLISNKPPSSTGIIRPRKQLLAGPRLRPAELMTAYEYDIRNQNSPTVGKAPGTVLISNKPPSSTGIIRPRKQLLAGPRLRPAELMTAYEYDIRNQNSPTVGKAPGTVLISNKPPSSTGIIRPRKQLLAGPRLRPAELMTAYEYDIRNQNSPTVGKAPGTVLISNKPPSSTGIIRPRKQLLAGPRLRPAELMTAYEYDIRNQNSPTVGKAPGTVLISNKPPSSTGIIRPRKQLLAGPRLRPAELMTAYEYDIRNQNSPTVGKAPGTVLISNKPPSSTGIIRPRKQLLAGPRLRPAELMTAYEYDIRNQNSPTVGKAPGTVLISNKPPSSTGIIRPRKQLLAGPRLRPAELMTAYEYDIRNQNSPTVGKAPGTVLISNKPPSSTGIIRPRKQLLAGPRLRPAELMTAYEYDIRNQNSPTVGKAPGTVLISNKPPSSTGIIRPRKQLLAGPRLRPAELMTAYEYDIRNQNSPTVGKAPGTVLISNKPPSSTGIIRPRKQLLAGPRLRPAELMTAYEYDIRNQNSPTVGKAPGTVLISNKPPSSTGIIRPRKQLLAGPRLRPAELMTAYEYDIRNQNSPTVGKAPGTVLISNKPPSSTGIIRPRKQLLAGPRLRPAELMTAYEYDIRNQNSPTVGKAPGTVLISNKPPSSTGIIRPRKQLLAGVPSR